MSNGIFTNPETGEKAAVITGISLALFLIEIVNLVFGLPYDIFGIQPQKLFGLVGILTSPLVHSDFQHFLSNIFPFIIFGAFTICDGILRFIKVTLFVILVTGILVWMLSSPMTIIVGASGVIFGYMGYLIGRAGFKKDWKSVIIALGCLFFFGSMLFGILPSSNSSISWQSHLFGLISGIVASWIWRKK